MALVHVIDLAEYLAMKELPVYYLFLPNALQFFPFV